MTSTVLLALAVFGACAVESVEAFTLVLAAGTTGGWRSALEGTAGALAVLAALVLAVGIPLVDYVPIDVLRVVIGALLLTLGLGWLRKAILRASGHKERHDEDAIYANTVAGLSAGRRASSSGRDAAAFAVAFKGVLLEGLEVVLIVVSLGASSHHLGLASVMAVTAVVAVVGVGAIVARQLREVPENTLKFAVGVMLTSFGLFWVGEGSGLRWPGSDAWILVLVAGNLVVAVGVVRWLAPLSAGRRAVVQDQPAKADQASMEEPRRAPSTAVAHAIRAFARFWVDFLVGDAPEIFLGTLVLVASALVSRHQRPVGVPLVPAIAALLLVWSTCRGRNRQVPAETVEGSGRCR